MFKSAILFLLSALAANAQGRCGRNFDALLHQQVAGIGRDGQRVSPRYDVAEFEASIGVQGRLVGFQIAEHRAQPDYAAAGEAC